MVGALQLLFVSMIANVGGAVFLDRYRGVTVQLVTEGFLLLRGSL